MQQDPVITALGSSAALQPVGTADLDNGIAAITSSLLSVAISLLPSEAGPDTDPVIIGNMTLGRVSPRTAHHRNTSIGIKLLREHQGKGYGGEALDWMLDWAFRHAGMHTVSLTAVDFNQSAIGLYRKLGFRVEGRRKEVVYFDGGWHDEIDFGMTEREWEVLRERREMSSP